MPPSSIDFGRDTARCPSTLYLRPPTLRKGDNVFTAHRSHLYQRLVIAGYSHRTVTLLYIGLAATGAMLAALWYSDGSASDPAVILALPLLCVGLWRGMAGRARVARRRPISRS